MERQIKFRGYSEQLKCFVYGFFQEIEVEGVVYSYIFWQGNLTPVKADSVGQFTSLLDSKGIEIYEGDYLVDRYPIDYEDLSLGYIESLLPVVWCNKTLSWCVDGSFKKDGSYLVNLVEFFGEFLKVKGNIHDKSLDN